MKFNRTFLLTCLLYLGLYQEAFSVEPFYYKQVLNLRGNWKFSIGDYLRWSDPEYNDQTWEEIYVPSRWENEGFSGFDGYAWYRKTIPGNKFRFHENLYLNLGYIDDVDEVYFNGERIGFTGSFPPDFITAYNARRVYFIPPELINYEGSNTIAVRVFDFKLEGGIVSGDIGIYSLRFQPENLLVLDGIWKFLEGDSPNFIKPNHNDENWSAFHVPGIWKIKDHFVHDDGSSVAWLRREFELPKELSGMDLTIHLGKIDDFDEVFINGYFVGATNDGKRIGKSKSWLVRRVYEIPKEYLNPNERNVIAIRVFDLGGDSGIYPGPVAIMKPEEVTRFIRYHD
jgi:sialate O-acetylesterase